jgi:hypothetical protein
MRGEGRTVVAKDIYLIIIVINDVSISKFDRGQRRLNR